MKKKKTGSFTYHQGLRLESGQNKSDGYGMEKILFGKGAYRDIQQEVMWQTRGGEI